jgi:hypothetical protein
MDIIERVQQQGANFKTAIRSSRASAQDGSEFCADFVTLLKCLQNKKISDDEIHEFISEMQNIARRAHANATEAVELFQLVRHGIYTVSLTPFPV